MPEGHTIHRLAADYRERFGGRAVRADSPQGRFAGGAALIDGEVLRECDAHGKNLFLGFGWRRWVHIHLGLYGKVAFGDGPPPAPTGQIRLRLASPEGYAELRGPTTCALLSQDEKSAVQRRLGPDPLRADADPDLVWRRISAARTSIAELLMDQRVIAGVGNVYRAEILFRHGIDPYRQGRSLTEAEWRPMWADLAALMREGVRKNRIDTVRPEHMPQAMGRPARVDGHGGEVYVYRRATLPCLVCGTAIRRAELAARNLFWCPVCQAAG
ncbi:Fpg/Nei family DNA glycosylase [Streptomyces carpaticus]|uniref:DNA-(apurinic or apyrimidinic site) lyase n=2 Tax=Streptomyces TaxID=1883 RepID=A0A1I6UR01_9ACTN|nr:MULTISPECIES: DNA-formamidopyrimidine glycosylase family protein [Streptomyces]MCK1813789.1 Fpg/Nei family DNA glycosylase [Streptomyces sp. XM4011]UWM49178.1 Fpg/Nei family DNA glycosylase [Streptomyces carpaticus]SFT03764.1 endonuclease-8 [Streptomyces harbinensis]